MNDQQIYVLMAKTPNIRAVQIADALDKDMKDVSEALRSLVDCGDVIAHTGEAPNGQPTRMYNLSDEFKRSKVGRALLTSVVGAMLAEPVAPALPPASAPPVETPVFATQKEMAPVRTKAQIAIEHLTTHKRNVDPGKRPVNDTDMRNVLGLPRASNAKAYLTAQLKRGLIVRDADGHWHLGDGTPPPPAGQSPSLRSYGSKEKGPVAQFAPNVQPDPAPSPSPPIEEVKTMSQPEHTTAPAAPAPAAPPAPTVFRCGLWSDGVLELQRDGVQVMALNRGEHEQLADFMGRMLGQVDNQRDPGLDVPA